MIRNRLTFAYKNRILVEKVTLSPPFRYKAIFQNEGCFIHIRGSESQILSAEQTTHLNNKEAVLLQCGNYFVDWLKHSKEDEIEVTAVHLYPEVLREIFDAELPKSLIQPEHKEPVKTVVPEETISEFVESLNFYFRNPALVNDDLLELKIKELILLLVQTKNTGSVRELFSSLFSPRTLNMKKVVRQHVYSNISVGELAELCNMSLSSFKREFKHVFNASPLQYINTQRISKAKELLMKSDLPVADIAYATGFNDPLYFTRLFKRSEEVSPTQYRTLHKD